MTEMANNTVLQVEFTPQGCPSMVDVAQLPAAFHEFFAIEER